MSKKFSLIIFTDLDGSLLHRDNFRFDEIKDYLKKIIDDGIIVIPNTSKTQSEIEEFIKDLGSSLPFISENGSEIHGLDLINSNFPNKIILSRDKKELLEIFNKKVPKELKDQCKFISEMNTKEQIDILGLKDKNLKNALNRKYTIPFLFKGNKVEKNKLLKVLRSASLTMQEGGRVLNLGDNTNKVKSMNQVLKIYKKIERDFRNGELYLKRAITNASLGINDRALLDFNKSLHLDADNYMAHFGKSNMLYQTYINSDNNELYSIEQVIKGYDKCIELNPKFAYAYFNRAYLKFQNKNYIGAIDDYSEAINISPSFAEAYLNRALILLILEN